MKPSCFEGLCVPRRGHVYMCSSFRLGQLLLWQLCLKLCTPPHSCQRAQPAIEPCGSACQPMTPLLPTAAFGFGLECTSCRRVCRETRHWRAEGFIRTGHCNAIPEAIRGGVRIPLPEDPFLGSAGICRLAPAAAAPAAELPVLEFLFSPSKTF